MATSSPRPLILHHAEILVTMDADRREISDGALVATRGRIDWVGASAELPPQYAEAARRGEAEVIEARGQVETGQTADHKEAARAFVEKRAPVFVGR